MFRLVGHTFASLVFTTQDTSPKPGKIPLNWTINYMRVSKRKKKQTRKTDQRFLPHHYTWRSSEWINSSLAPLERRPFIAHGPMLGNDGMRALISYAELKELDARHSAHTPHVINLHWFHFDSDRRQLAITNEKILSIKATRYERGKIATENFANE